MKGSLKLTYSLLIICSTLISCSNKDEQPSVDEWYRKTKTELLRQSKVKSDSIMITYNEDSSYRREHHFYNGKQILLKGFNLERLSLEIYYSLDQSFELRREVCGNGSLGFEGITYKEKFFGTSTWMHCNGQVSQKGIRYNGEKIGVWKNWDENGDLIKEFDYKNIEKLRLFPEIYEN